MGMTGAAAGGVLVAGGAGGRARPERRGTEAETEPAGAAGTLGAAGRDALGGVILSCPLTDLGGVDLGIVVRGLAGAAPRGRNSNFVPQRGQTRLEAPLTASASKTWVQAGLGHGKVDGMAVSRLTLRKRI